MYKQKYLKYKKKYLELKDNLSENNLHRELKDLTGGKSHRILRDLAGGLTCHRNPHTQHYGECWHDSLITDFIYGELVGEEVQQKIETLITDEEPDKYNKYMIK